LGRNTSGRASVVATLGAAVDAHVPHVEQLPDPHPPLAACVGCIDAPILCTHAACESRDSDVAMRACKRRVGVGSKRRAANTTLHATSAAITTACTTAYAVTTAAS
jgi:hypothetical protein